MARGGARPAGPALPAAISRPPPPLQSPAIPRTHIPFARQHTQVLPPPCASTAPDSSLLEARPIPGRVGAPPAPPPPPLREHISNRWVTPPAPAWHQDCKHWCPFTLTCLQRWGGRPGGLSVHVSMHAASGGGRQHWVRLLGRDPRSGLPPGAAGHHAFPARMAAVIVLLVLLLHHSNNRIEAAFPSVPRRSGTPRAFHYSFFSWGSCRHLQAAVPRLPAAPKTPSSPPPTLTPPWPPSASSERPRSRPKPSWNRIW